MSIDLFLCLSDSIISQQFIFHVYKRIFTWLAKFLYIFPTSNEIISCSLNHFIIWYKRSFFAKKIMNISKLLELLPLIAFKTFYLFNFVKNQISNKVLVMLNSEWIIPLKLKLQMLKCIYWETLDILRRILKFPNQNALLLILSFNKTNWNKFSFKIKLLKQS